MSLYHVMMRGARRLLLYRDDADRAAFLNLLAETLQNKPLKLHAFALMDNHYHLMVGADEQGLSRSMQSLNRRFSRGNNKKYGLQGHLFEGSYLAFPLTGKFWIGRTARYLDFNPVQAGLAATPEQYPWSSARTYLKGFPSPVPLDTQPVLDALGGVNGYRAFVPPIRRKKTSRAITAMDLWTEQAGWLLQWATERQAELEGEAPRTLAVSWARDAGIPPRAIAKAFGYAGGHSVSVLLDSLRKRAEKSPRLRELMEPPK